MVVGRFRNEALGCVFTHVVFPLCVMAFVLLWMGFFYLLDMIFPAKSHAGKVMIAILQIIALVTSYGGGWLAMGWLARDWHRGSSVERGNRSRL